MRIRLRPDLLVFCANFLLLRYYIELFNALDALTINSEMETNVIPLMGEESVSIKLNISSIAKESPIIIEKPVLQLVDYSGLDNHTSQMFYSDFCGGGGGGYHPYVIQDFPQPESNTTMPFQIDENEYKPSVGMRADAQLLCDAENCDQFVFINPGEVDGIQIDMPFITKMPNGHYVFDIFFEYSYQGKTYQSTSSYTFEIVKPNSISIWLSPGCKEINKSFVEINETGKIYTTIPETPTGNPEGTLIFESRASMGNEFYKLNLRSGKVSILGYQGWIPQIEDDYFSTRSFSPDGWMQVVQIYPNKNISPVGSRIPETDVGIIDLSTERFLNITRADPRDNIQPSWSPSGKQIAYVSFARYTEFGYVAGHADIFIYDLDEGNLVQVTHTPEIVEAKPVWLDESTIAFLLPDMGNYWDHVPQNKQVGIGIIDIDSGRITIFDSINVHYNDYFGYLTQSDKLVLNGTKLISRTGELELERDDTSAICKYLDTERPKQLCWGAEGVYIYDFDTQQVNELAGDKRLSDDRWGGLIIGSAIPEGFIIADILSNEINQYSEDGTLIQTWDVPELNRFFYGVFLKDEGIWESGPMNLAGIGPNGQNNMILIPGQ